MLPDDTRRKIADIVSGAIIAGEGNNCTAIRNLLCSGFATSAAVKEDFEGKSVVKKEQAALIENYCYTHGMWLEAMPEERYLTRGGEARVYLHHDSRQVIKLNDGIYYATWLEFFNSILLHNLIFENTSYKLAGFAKEEDVLCAVLLQPFIIADAQVELEDVRKFLEFNGFTNSRRNDYIHKELGLILEDMHDENVLVNADTLFFIDSVFYTVRPVGQ